FSSVKTVLSWYDLLFFTESYIKWAVYFLALMSQFDMTTSEEICKRLELAPRYTTIFLKERLKAEKSLLWLERNQQLTNSTLYKELYGIKTEIILFMMAVTKHKKVKQSVSHFFTKLKYIRPSIRGKDLLKTGIEPGPIYREILQAVLDAKLNGKLKTQQDELNFMRRYVS
ncbi:MAG TPA: polya polymerase, partial [Desulfobacterales bacterium]|nr:polya polymerase [Desulfobacterales bacterium]